MAVRTIEVRERVMARNDELAGGVERALHARANLRGRRDVAGPLEALRIDVFLHHETIRVERADAEGRRLAGLQEHFARDDLELRGLAGRGPFFRRRFLAQTFSGTRAGWC